MTLDPLLQILSMSILFDSICVRYNIEINMNINSNFSEIEEIVIFVSFKLFFGCERLMVAKNRNDMFLDQAK